MPIFTAIDCSVMDAKTAISKVHKRDIPNFTPARVQSVTVPGPMNAAAISGPGPRFLKSFFKHSIDSNLKITYSKKLHNLI
jgi:hypothetical protein